MNAVRYRVAHRLRAERGPLVRLALLVGVVSAIVLAIAAGAHRTATAPDRYVERAASRFDALVTQDDGPPRVSEIAALPSVDEAAGFTFLFAGLVGGDELADMIVFAGDLGAFDLRLVDGRASDPTRADEVVITRSAADSDVVAVGDVLTFVSFTRPGFEGEPDGPTFDVTVVGIADGPGDGDPTESAMPTAIFPFALLDTGPIANALTLTAIELAPGADLDQVRGDLDTLDHPELLSVAPRSALNDSVRRAVDTVARGLWILAAAAAAAAIAALGQLVARQVRLTDGDRAALAAIGYESDDVRRECLVVSALAVTAGAVLGSLAAFAASGLFPIGFVRDVEPSNGIRMDWVVVPLGAVVLAMLVVGWVGGSLRLASMATRRRAGARPTARGMAAWPDTAVAVGVRFAFWRGDRDTGAVRAAAIGLGLTVVALTGAAVVGSSLDRLVHDKTAFGEFYDMRFDMGQDAISDDMLDAVSSDPDVGAITTMSGDQARIGDATIRLVGFEQVRGSLRPSISDGRLPESDDQIALGRVQADRLGLDIGDALTVDGSLGSVTYEVVGIAVVPSVGENDGVGEDGLVTMPGLRRVSPDIPDEALVADLRPGAPAGAAQRVMSAIVPLSSGQEIPVAVVNLDRVRFVPLALAGFLLLLALITAVHALNTAIRNRRRDFAVLRALGATRRWTGRAVVAHAVAFIVVPTVLAIPLGVVAGSAVFRLMADSIGTLRRSSTPFATLVGGTALATTVLAVVALVAGRWIHRTSPGALLRSE